MSDAKYISSININEVVYQIKDKEARADIDNLDTKINSKVDMQTNSNVNAVLNFENGIQISGAEIKYEPSSNTVNFI